MLWQEVVQDVKCRWVHAKGVQQATRGSACMKCHRLDKRKTPVALRTMCRCMRPQVELLGRKQFFRRRVGIWASKHEVGIKVQRK
jgi:hypothetical protein